MPDAIDPPWLEGIAGGDARKLIASDDPLIRVVAGPGAGKTTCLKRRTRRLIEGDGVPAERIFVGTFTRAIANELRQEHRPGRVPATVASVLDPYVMPSPLRTRPR